MLPAGYVKKDGVKYDRAGLCWACPVGTGTIQGDDDLCLILPGYGRQMALPERIPIPTLGKDLYLVLREPKLIFASLAEETRRRRRLLSSMEVTIDARRAGAVAVADNSMTMIMACPPGYFKEGRGMANCKSCPAGTSTINVTSYSVKMCLCLPGWFRLNNKNKTGACSPCLENTFRNLTTATGDDSEDTCTRCPPNETTHGRTGSTACSCIPGFVRKNGICVPCDEGTYCTPCVEGSTCPLSGVLMTACFFNSTSPPGSTSITQCTCLSGLVPLRRGPSSYYCAPVPPMAIYDPLTKKVGCKRGWTAQWVDNSQQLVGCQLCPMGYYAQVDPSLQQLQQPPTANENCKKCPKGTYSAFTDMIGGCTPCLEPQTTDGEGSTSPESCGCPSPTRKVGDKCEGCLTNQYLVNGVCLPCPAFSISGVGAVSVSECKCMAGYSFQAKTANCQICPTGTYSSHASDSGCKACPKGSTTAGLGSKSVRECGATQDLCLAGYSWRGVYLGCALSSSLA